MAAEGGGTRDLVYVGARGGGLVAVDRATGAIAWKALGSGQLDGVFGTPTLDRASHTLYAATWGDDLHALDEATGEERPGWPIHLTPDEPDQRPRLGRPDARRPEASTSRSRARATTPPTAAR